MEITYSCEQPITVAQFTDVLRRSTLAERRPVDDPVCLEGMVRNANLVCTAWHGDTLVGVARSVTDFTYCCYLSDLAVDVALQHQGIGKSLIRLTQSRLGPQCKIILLAAPKAEGYYPKLGFTRHASAWLVPANPPIS